MAGFLKPTDLEDIASEAEMVKMAKERKYKQEDEERKKALYEAFMARDLHPNVVERVNDAIRIAAQQGHHKLEVMTFPTKFCNDRGRRINNGDADWPVSLEGFAKRGYDFYEKELKPLGFKISAEIISFEGGVPGTVAMHLKW